MENENTKFWITLEEVLQKAKKALPSSTEPNVIPYYDEAERWKEEAQVEQAEEELLDETIEMIEYFCENHEWPEDSDAVARYFVEKRLNWALDISYIFKTPFRKKNEILIRRPKSNGYELIEWLLTDAYDSRDGPPIQTEAYFKSYATSVNTRPNQS